MSHLQTPLAQIVGAALGGMTPEIEAMLLNSGGAITPEIQEAILAAEEDPAWWTGPPDGFLVPPVSVTSAAATTASHMPVK